MITFWFVVISLGCSLCLLLTADGLWFGGCFTIVCFDYLICCWVLCLLLYGCTILICWCLFGCCVYTLELVLLVGFK